MLEEAWEEVKVKNWKLKMKKFAHRVTAIPED
jgi:hypothetical protein